MRRLCNLMPPRPDRCLLIDAYRPVHDPAGPHQVVRWRWAGDPKPADAIAEQAVSPPSEPAP